MIWAMFVGWDQFANQFLATLIYATLGLVLFTAAFWAIVRAAPFSVRKEIEEDQNTALGVIIAAVIIGIAYIVGSAIHG